jgi:hypothetical protein
LKICPIEQGFRYKLLLLESNNNNNYIQADDDERYIKIHKLTREQITAELKNGRRIKSSPTISALFLVKEVYNI